MACTGLALDHVLVSIVMGVQRFRVLGSTGCDHRGIVADLKFRGFD